MMTKSDEKILKLLQTTIQGEISSCEYSIMHAQEASTCINFKNDKWVVSHYERAIKTRSVAEYPIHRNYVPHG